MIIKLYRALWARNVLQHYTDVIEKVGETHRETVLGKNAIMTVDPENIKAILSTQFDGMNVCVEQMINRCWYHQCHQSPG